MGERGSTYSSCLFSKWPSASHNLLSKCANILYHVIPRHHPSSPPNPFFPQGLLERKTLATVNTAWHQQQQQHKQKELEQQRVRNSNTATNKSPTQQPGKTRPEPASTTTGSTSPANLQPHTTTLTAIHKQSEHEPRPHHNHQTNILNCLWAAEGADKPSCRGPQNRTVNPYENWLRTKGPP